MTTRSATPPVHLSYSATMKTVMPGLIVGMMFLLAAFATCSTNERVVLLLQLSNSASGDSVRAYENATLLRPLRGRSRDENIVPTIQPQGLAINTGLQMLQSSSSLTPVERVTLEIPFGDRASGTATIRDEQKGLLELLTRRMEPLDLRINIRVAPGNLPRAVKLLDELSGTFSVAQDKIGISVDRTLPSDILCLDVLRSAMMLAIEEIVP